MFLTDNLIAILPKCIFFYIVKYLKLAMLIRNLISDAEVVLKYVEFSFTCSTYF